MEKTFFLSFKEIEVVSRKKQEPLDLSFKSYFENNIQSSLKVKRLSIADETMFLLV